jgi:hypothetical protein
MKYLNEKHKEEYAHDCLDVLSEKERQEHAENCVKEAEMKKQIEIEKANVAEQIRQKKFDSEDEDYDVYDPDGKFKKMESDQAKEKEELKESPKEGEDDTKIEQLENDDVEYNVYYNHFEIAESKLR